MPAGEQTEEYDGEDGHDGAEPGQVVLDGGDGLPHQGDRGGGDGADEAAAAERREVAEQHQRQDQSGGHGGEPRGPRPVIGVRGGPGGEDAEAAGGEQQRGRQTPVALPDLRDERTGRQQDERRGREGAGQRIQGELAPGEQRGDHREGHGRHTRTRAARGGTPAPGLQIEIVGHQIGDVVHDRGGGAEWARTSRSTAPSAIPAEDSVLSCGSAEPSDVISCRVIGRAAARSSSNCRMSGSSCPIGVSDGRTMSARRRSPTRVTRLSCAREVVAVLTTLREPIIATL